MEDFIGATSSRASLTVFVKSSTIGFEICVIYNFMQVLLCQTIAPVFLSELFEAFEALFGNFSCVFLSCL